MEIANRQGLHIIQHFLREDGSGFAYLDSDKKGELFFELLVYPSKK